MKMIISKMQSKMFLIKIIWNSVAKKTTCCDAHVKLINTCQQNSVEQETGPGFPKIAHKQKWKGCHLLSSTTYKAQHSGNHVIQEFQWNFNLKCIDFSQTLIAPYLTLHKSTGTTILPDKLNVTCIAKQIHLSCPCQTDLAFEAL